MLSCINFVAIYFAKIIWLSCEQKEVVSKKLPFFVRTLKCYSLSVSHGFVAKLILISTTLLIAFVSVNSFFFLPHFKCIYQVKKVQILISKLFTSGPFFMSFFSAKTYTHKHNHSYTHTNARTLEKV